MNKKTLFIIFILVIIVIGFGLLSFPQFFSGQEIEVGDVNFDLPNGYYLNNSNKLGDVAITNGSHAVYLAKYDDGNVKDYVNSYVNEANKTGENVTITNFTVENILVQKSSLSNHSANHYWFTYNGTVYSIYNWNENPKMDTIVFDLIRSIKPTAD